MNQEQRQLIKRVLNILLRRKVLIYICLFLGVVIGLGYYLQAPKVYRTTSLIMYQQRINPTEMSPDLGHFQEIVSTVSQQINSRSSLEGLITQFNLYKGLRERLPMEDVVEIMRKNIAIRPSRSGNTFEVAYKGSQPRTVLLVTNALAARFIEENIRLREETVSETSSYIKDELKMAKDALNKKEAAMRDYKLKYYNEMPDKLASNISRLNALQTQYQGYQDSLQDLERTKVLIQEQISVREELLVQIKEAQAKGLSTPEQVQSKESQLNELRERLENLKTRYTEKHPDIKSLKSLIARLEKDLAEKESEREAGTAESGIEMTDPQIYKMQQQLENIEYNNSRLVKEREETKQQIEKYKEWIAAAPVREAEWTDLTRDYNQLSSHYQELVAKNIQANSAESLERRQKGSQFKIVDPAHFPEKPYSPDFINIMLLAMGIGLGAGGALAVGLEFLDTSFRDAHDLETFLGLPVACSIPVIMTDIEKRRKFMHSAILLVLFLFSLSILGGGIAFLWYKGIVII
jgi:polysaccharide chain length determinant protein (PEP-CTERM system associated)